jgi:hypothetical protein
VKLKSKEIEKMGQTPAKQDIINEQISVNTASVSGSNVEVNHLTAIEVFGMMKDEMEELQ